MRPSTEKTLPARNHRELIVWQKAIELVIAVTRIARSLPAIEKYELARQMRTASVSIAANIAEGRGRTTLREYARFLAIARGSARELDTCFELARRLDYLRSENTVAAAALLDEVSRMLTAMLRKLTPL